METMPAETVWEAANDIPPEWYGGDPDDMEALVEKLLARRSRIREQIEAFGNSDRKPFPKWGAMGKEMQEASWNAERWGITITGSAN
jgi:hypothetical protein